MLRLLHQISGMRLRHRGRPMHRPGYRTGPYRSGALGMILRRLLR